MMADDWRQSFYPAGSPVHLFRANAPAPDGPQECAVLLTDFDRDDPNREHPRFRTADGTILSGAECWWIPVAEDAQPRSVIRTSCLRRDCAACGNEIQPFEPYRRVTIEPAPHLAPFYRTYHLACAP